MARSVRREVTLSEAQKLSVTLDLASNAASEAAPSPAESGPDAPAPAPISEPAPSGPKDAASGSLPPAFG